MLTKANEVSKSSNHEGEIYTQARQAFIQAQIYYLLAVIGIATFFFLFFTHDLVQVKIDQSIHTWVSSLSHKQLRPVTYLELGLILAIQTTFAILIATGNAEISARRLPHWGFLILGLVVLSFIILCSALSVYMPPSLSLAFGISAYFATHMIRTSFFLQRQIKLSIKDHFRFETAKKQNSFLKKFSEEIMQDVSRMQSDLHEARRELPEQDSDSNDIWLEDAEQSLSELNNYIEVIHQFSRFLQRDPHSVSMENVRVLPILNRLIYKHMDQIKSKDLKINTICQDSAILKTDETLFEQIVANLLSNAVKYSPPKGHIWIEFEVKMQTAVLKVRDEGIGIDPKYHKRVFEKFFRIDEHEQSKGNGLGLYLSRFFARLLQGDIHLESKPQTGATFQLLLPQP